MTARPSKYRAKRTEIDGITFASKAEAKRYSELKLLERAGQIRNLKLQVRFPIDVNGIRVCAYVADFVYEEGGKKIIEDKKGVATAVYILKRKLFAAVYGATIKET